VAVASNDDRSKYLTGALRDHLEVPPEVPFDDISWLTRYLAALLSYRRNRGEWWVTYQMHPLVQRRRRRVLQRNLQSLRGRIDGLVMWGSWFNPRLDQIGESAPFVTYVDQSLSLRPVLGEPAPDGGVDRRRAHRLQARTYASATAVLCMSEWAREQTMLAHPSLPAEKVKAVGWGPCGVDLSGELPDWERREPLVLHVSNDFHRKGLDYLVQTAEIVRQSVPAARFVVIGEDYGGMRGIPSSEGVTMVGKIRDPAVLTGYFRKASVFFLPHRFDRSPHVLVEAMSASLPLVTSAQGGPLELTRGTEAGWALPIGDVAGYARTITALLQNRDTAAHTGEHGRRLMLRAYTWDVVARRILAEFSGRRAA
jgi:glycosyltransferase involved in cell wall biosynthesis